MVDVFLKSAIHNALMKAVRDAKFYAVEYAGKGEDTAMSTRRAADNEIRPASVETNETKSTFTPSEDHRVERLRRRNSTRWDIELTFDDQVAMEDFEDGLTRTIKADPTNGVPGLHVALLETDYSHPPRRDPDNGTWAHVLVEVTPDP